MKNGRLPLEKGPLEIHIWAYAGACFAYALFSLWSIYAAFSRWAQFELVIVGVPFLSIGCLLQLGLALLRHKQSRMRYILGRRWLFARGALLVLSHATVLALSFDSWKDFHIVRFLGLPPSEPLANALLLTARLSLVLYALAFASLFMGNVFRPDPTTSD